MVVSTFNGRDCTPASVDRPCRSTQCRFHNQTPLTGRAVFGTRRIYQSGTELICATPGTSTWCQRYPVFRSDPA